MLIVCQKSHCFRNSGTHKLDSVVYSKQTKQVCADINGVSVQLDAGSDRSALAPMHLGIVFDVEIPSSAKGMAECTIDMSRG